MRTSPAIYREALILIEMIKYDLVAVVPSALNRIAQTALTPDYIQNTKYADKFDATWVLDREKGLGRLKQLSPHLTNYTVKLAPMLGCIGVAPPAHQSFRTGWIGPHGPRH